MNRFPPIQLETFILRFWWEESNQTWRGEIVHLPGRESRHFATLSQAEGFIESFISGVDDRPKDHSNRNL